MVKVLEQRLAASWSRHNCNQDAALPIEAGKNLLLGNKNNEPAEVHKTVLWDTITRANEKLSKATNFLLSSVTSSSLAFYEIYKQQ